MTVVSKHACGERRLAQTYQGSPPPPLPHSPHSLSREHSSIASTAGPESSFPPRWSRLMAAFSSCCSSLRCSAPKPGVGGQSEEQREFWSPGTRPTGQGTLTGRRGGVEVGGKALYVTTHGEAFIGDAKGPQYGH